MLAPVREDMSRLSRQLGLSEGLGLLERAWQSEIGDLARWARLVALERSSLVVETSSSAAMQEIALRKRELIRRINQHLPPGSIKGLTVRMASHHG